jgi:hypothetical protein
MEFKNIHGPKEQSFQQLEELKKQYDIKLISIGYFFNNIVDISLYKLKPKE